VTAPSGGHEIHNDALASALLGGKTTFSAAELARFHLDVALEYTDFVFVGRGGDAGYYQPVDDSLSANIYSCAFRPNDTFAMLKHKLKQPYSCTRRPPRASSREGAVYLYGLPLCKPRLSMSSLTPVLTRSPPQSCMHVVAPRRPCGTPTHRA
jgi:hypothetical protein